ncbi:MAG: NADH-quinone oxidoreductase subunit NuoK [Myxococcota bacterium]
MNEILFVSTVLFCIGLFGLLIRRNFLFILLSIEVMFNSAAFAFAAISCHLGKPDGQILFLLVAAIAAAEIAIGLALLIAHDRLFKTTDLG